MAHERMHSSSCLVTEFAVCGPMLCCEACTRLFICNAEDTIKGEKLILQQCYAVVGCNASSYETSAGKKTNHTVCRRQYPVTTAYGFIDYHSQGQTSPNVLTDIATPPLGTLTLFNLYIALSRSSERETIRLLWDCKD